jgi:cardiolipin synthase
MTVPNAVTLVRFVLLLPVCVMLVRGGPDTLAVILLLVWALTDWVDGLLARALDQKSRTGEVMDPIADRLGLVGICLSLLIVGLFPVPVFVILLLVDVVVLVRTARAALDGSLHVSMVGKARTAALMSGVFLLAALAAWAPTLVPVAQGLLWVDVVLHVIAAAGYLVTVRRATGHRGPGQGDDASGEGVPVSQP